MYPLKTFRKDPSDVLDYSFDWTTDGWIGSDTITGTPVWTVPSGITKDSQSNTTTVTTAWFSGGTAGQDYDISCRITTVGTRTAERTLRLQVRQR